MSLALLVLWLILTGSLETGQILLAAIIAVGMSHALAQFHLRPKKPVPNPGLWLRLFLRVSGDIMLANFGVAWVVLTRPGRALRPAFLVVPLDLRDPWAITLFAGIISITPGTVSADLDTEGDLLLVHCLDEPDPEAAVARLKQRYERPLKEIFG
jgi:multicomponent K+:H+ antiporter subunit E